MEWRVIPSHPDYEASDEGQVRSWRGYAGVRLDTPRLKAARLGTNGYLVTDLVSSPEGKKKTRSVHQLVAEAFLGPRPPGREVCHLDGDKTNNSASTLRYDTHKGNHADRKEHGTNNAGAKNGGAKLSASQVGEMRRLYRDLNVSTRTLAEKFNVSVSTAWRAVRGISWAS